MKFLISTSQGKIEALEKNYFSCLRFIEKKYESMTPTPTTVTTTTTIEESVENVKYNLAVDFYLFRVGLQAVRNPDLPISKTFFPNISKRSYDRRHSICSAKTILFRICASQKISCALSLSVSICLCVCVSVSF
jgi:hypothetical protein